MSNNSERDCTQYRKLFLTDDDDDSDDDSDDDIDDDTTQFDRTLMTNSTKERANVVNLSLTLSLFSLDFYELV